MDKNSILICIPTYNERGNIELLYKDIKAQNQSTDILFIDDNSPDGTGKTIDSLKEKDATVHAIHRSGKLGLGTAQKRAFAFAKENGYKKLIIMDADFMHDPKYIPSMIEKSNNADIVIGSRYAQGGQINNWSKLRKPLTVFWRNILKWCLGLDCDATGAFRLYNVSILKPEIYEQVTSKGFVFGMEVLYRFVEAGATFTEVPITPKKRIYGESKLSAGVMREEVARVSALTFERLFKRKKKPPMIK